jgi:hypothetical protein
MPNFPCTTCGAHGAYVGPETNGPVCASCGNPMRETAAPEAVVPDKSLFVLPDPPQLTEQEVALAAERAYLIHTRMIGPLNHSGEALIAWDDLPESRRDAWKAGAAEVAAVVREVLLEHVRVLLST